MCSRGQRSVSGEELKVIGVCYGGLCYDPGAAACAGPEEVLQILLPWVRQVGGADSSRTRARRGHEKHVRCALCSARGFIDRL